MSIRVVVVFVLFALLSLTSCAPIDTYPISYTQPAPIYGYNYPVYQTPQVQSLPGPYGLPYSPPLIVVDRQYPYSYNQAYQRPLYPAAPEIRVLPGGYGREVPRFLQFERPHYYEHPSTPQHPREEYRNQTHRPTRLH